MALRTGHSVPPPTKHNPSSLSAPGRYWIPILNFASSHSQEPITILMIFFLKSMRTKTLSLISLCRNSSSLLCVGILTPQLFPNPLPRPDDWLEAAPAPLHHPLQDPSLRGALSPSHTPSSSTRKGSQSTGPQDPKICRHTCLGSPALQWKPWCPTEPMVGSGTGL